MIPDQADPDDTVDIKKGLETSAGRAQDARVTPTLASVAPPEQRNARTRTQQKVVTGAVSWVAGGGKSVLYQHFAEQLAAAMKEQGLNASEVARRIWGTKKDRRNYDVARNRDRIGHYLSGRSYPEPENLRKLAEALGIPVEQLAMPESEGNPGPRAPKSSSSSSPGILQLIPVPQSPNKIRLRGSIDVVIDRAQAQEAINLLMTLWSKTDPAPSNDLSQPAPGDVIVNHNHAS